MKLFRRHVRQDPAQVSVPDRIGKPGGKKFQREVLVTDRGEKLSDLCSPACNPCPKKGIVKSQKCTGFLVISNKKSGAGSSGNSERRRKRGQVCGKLLLFSLETMEQQYNTAWGSAEKRGSSVCWKNIV